MAKTSTSDAKLEDASKTALAEREKTPQKASARNPRRARLPPRERNVLLAITKALEGKL